MMVLHTEMHLKYGQYNDQVSLQWQIQDFSEEGALGWLEGN